MTNVIAFALIGGIIASVLIIIGLYKLIDYIINYYPNKIITIDITKKKNMNDDDLLDYYLINYGTESIEHHIKVIKTWKDKKLAKLNQKKRQKFLNKCSQNNYKAFTFEGVRTQTRYKQVNYQRYGYQTTVVSNSFYANEAYVLDRIKFLKSHNYNITYNNFNKTDQRKALTKNLRLKIIERDKYTCQICGKYMPDEVGLQVDHIIPVSQGGKSIESNLRVLCSKCNGKKGDKLDKDNKISEKLKDDLVYDEFGNRDSKIMRIILKYQKEFYNEYFKLDYSKMEEIVYNILEIKPLTQEEVNTLHFVILDMANLTYSLREKRETFENLSITLCKKDIENYDTLSKSLKGCVIGTLTRLCIIYEKNKKYNEAVNLCDIGIKYGFADSNKKNFIFRKEKLMKKIKS